MSAETIHHSGMSRMATSPPSRNESAVTRPKAAKPIAATRPAPRHQCPSQGCADDGSMPASRIRLSRKASFGSAAELLRPQKRIVALSARRLSLVSQSEYRATDRPCLLTETVTYAERGKMAGSPPVWRRSRTKVSDIGRRSYPLCRACGCGVSSRAGLGSGQVARRVDGVAI